jgi:hypothetical protein
MEMLHSRRKAEIEILSSSGLSLRTRKTGTAAFSASLSRDMDEQDATTPPCSHYTLLRYLALKISEAVASHRRDMSEREESDDDEVMD